MFRARSISRKSVRSCWTFEGREANSWGTSATLSTLRARKLEDKIWQKHDLEREEICLEKDSSESKITPRLRAEETGRIETLLGIDKIMSLTLESWERLPIRRNSVLVGFRAKKLEDKKKQEIVDSRANRPEAESEAENDVKSWVMKCAVWMTVWERNN